MPGIRMYEPKDFERVRMICQETDDSFAAEEREVLWCLFCDYYVEQEPEHTTVLANDADEAVGYLMIAADWETYKRIYRELYIPRLQQLNRRQTQEKEHNLDALPELWVEYPAHMHIDILPQFQSQGWGARLMDAGCEQLRNLGCPGLMLGVDAANTGAIRFYERYGFLALRRSPGAILYGLKL